MRHDDVVITGFELGPTRTVQPPRRWMRGAVHAADGTLLPDSQRTWSRDNPNAPIAVDPATIRPPRNPEHLAGTWVYAGHWSRHFGHFLVEVLPTLWPERTRDLVGVLTHRGFRQVPPVAQPRGRTNPAVLTDWQRDLLALTGYGDLPVRVVRGRPVRVERLVVPPRPVVFRTAVRPEAVALWRRMAAAAGAPAAPGQRVFLSRSRFHSGADAHDGRTTARWDRLLDETFAAAGFTVLHPEELSVGEQVRAVSGASVLAGSSGSALHQSVFCAPGTHVVEVGDARSPDRPQTSQTVIDAACGHRSSFVAYDDRAGLRRVLDALG